MQTSEGRDNEVNSEINTTPLIDVLLVLLIMLIVTLPPQHHGIRIDTPVKCDCPPKVDPPTPVRIFIDFDGSVSWNGVAMKMTEVDQKLAIEARHSVQPEIHIRPHRRAKYGYVAHVMAVAQREGLTRLGVVSES